MPPFYRWFFYYEFCNKDFTLLEKTVFVKSIKNKLYIHLTVNNIFIIVNMKYCSCLKVYQNIKLRRRLVIVKKNYRMKRTISMKGFIAELGDNFSEHMKKRLMELEIRCVLTRKEDEYRVDIKHVEHTKYDNAENNSGISQKEYAYGQFVVNEGTLYFSDSCLESTEVMQSPIVNTIYDSLSSEGMITDENGGAKKIDDSNIDYLIDSILAVCPQVSQKYIDIVKDMMSHSRK